MINRISTNKLHTKIHDDHKIENVIENFRCENIMEFLTIAWLVKENKSKSFLYPMCIPKQETFNI